MESADCQALFQGLGKGAQGQFKVEGRVFASKLPAAVMHAKHPTQICVLYPCF